MSKDVLREAIKKLEEDLETLLLQVKKKKQAINVLYETIGEALPYQTEDDSKVIRRDQFYGKAFATAASEFLKIMDHACTAEEILNGLEKGGFDFPWPQSGRLRGVAISVGKNTTTFHKLPNGTYGLAAWYSDAQMKRTRFSRNKPYSDEGSTDFKEEEKGVNIGDFLKE